MFDVLGRMYKLGTQKRRERKEIDFIYARSAPHNLGKCMILDRSRAKVFLATLALDLVHVECPTRKKKASIDFPSLSLPLWLVPYCCTASTLLLVMCVFHGYAIK